MAQQKKAPNVLNVILWIVQALLACGMLWGSWMKLAQPQEQLAVTWPWAGDVSPSLLKFTGIVDLLGGLGLILPAILRIRPKLTPITAICIVVLIIVASGFHIARGESASIAPNIAFALMAASVAWGRFKYPDA